MAVNFRTTDGVVHAPMVAGLDGQPDRSRCRLYLVTNPNYKILNHDGTEDLQTFLARYDSRAECTAAKVTCVLCLAGE